MLSTTALAHLRRHQDELSALLDQMAALLAGDATRAQLPLAGVRWSIARKARAYQLFKHGEIFGPVIASRRPVQAAVATEMRRACVAMSDAYEDHLRRWSGRDTATEWSAYRRDVAAIVTRLRRHLLTERQQVERLLAGVIEVRCVA